MIDIGFLSSTYTTVDLLDVEFVQQFEEDDSCSRVKYLFDSSSVGFVFRSCLRQDVTCNLRVIDIAGIRARLVMVKLVEFFKILHRKTKQN